MKLEVGNKKYENLKLQSDKIHQYDDGNIEIGVRDVKTTWIKAIIDMTEEELIDLIKDGLKLLKGKLIIHTNENILSAEYTKKFDEIYDYVRNNGKLLFELSNFYTCKNSANTDTSITENHFTSKKLENIMKNWLEKESKIYINDNIMPNENQKEIKILEKEKKERLDYWDKQINKTKEELRKLYPPVKYDKTGLKYESDGKRYSNFYKRVMNRICVDCEENRKVLIKEELVRLKEKVVVDDKIELTYDEIGELIQIIDNMMKKDINKFREKIVDKILQEEKNKSIID